MKVLIVHPCKGFYGGAEEVVVQLDKYLSNKGHECTTVLRDPPEKLPVASWGGSEHGVSSWLEFYELTRVNRKWADVICCFNFPATLAPFPTRKPIVWYCNEPPELFTSWKRKPIEAFNRWWVRKSGMKVIVADEMQATRFQGIYGVEPMVIPYGIDYRFWSQGEREEHKGPIKLLQVGTITPYKNQLESLCILSELIASGIDATLTLAGSDIADTNYSKELIDSLRVMEDAQPGFWARVRWTGQITQEKVRDLYRDHDVLLHPVGKQGGWLVPFEAMCASLPVLTTTNFTAAILIDMNDLGGVSEPGGMARRILSADYRGISTKAASEWVRDNLTWEKFGENMVKVFEEAIV